MDIRSTKNCLLTIYNSSEELSIVGEVDQEIDEIENWNILVMLILLSHRIEMKKRQS